MRIHSGSNSDKTNKTNILINPNPPLLTHLKRPLIIHTSSWAPSTWMYLHFTAFTYPDNPDEKYKEKTKLFFNNLLLPCELCETNYSKYIQLNPANDDVVNSRNNLVMWLIKFRNFERSSRKLPEIPPDSIINYYEAYDLPSSTDAPKSCCNHL